MRMAIINNGVVESVTDAPVDFALPGRTVVPCDESVGRFDTWDGTTFTRYAGDSTPRTKFAPVEFRALFTDEERHAINATTDPDILDANFEVASIISYVDLEDKRTIDLVSLLVLKGLLTSERAAQVLAGVAHV